MNFSKIARVISRILYLGINLSRPTITCRLELSIGFSSNRERWLSNLPFPLHHIQFTNITAHTVISSVAYTPNDFSPFSSKLDSIVSAALVVLIFYSIIYISRSSYLLCCSHDVQTFLPLFFQTNGRYLPLPKEYIYNHLNVKRFPIFLKKSIIYLYKLWENVIFNF